MCTQLLLFRILQLLYYIRCDPSELVLDEAAAALVPGTLVHVQLPNPSEATDGKGGGVDSEGGEESEGGGLSVRRRQSGSSSSSSTSSRNTRSRNSSAITAAQTGTASTTVTSTATASDTSADPAPTPLSPAVPYFGWGAVNAQCVGMVRELGHNGEVRRRFRVGECLSLQEMERKE